MTPVVCLFAIGTFPTRAAASSEPGAHAPGSGGGGQGPCGPSAVVIGPPAITDEVLELVRRHGIATGTEACARLTVRASLVSAPRSRGYDLEIVDAFGRRSQRRVKDARTAASLIESFAVPEDAMLVTPPPPALVSGISATTGTETAGVAPPPRANALPNDQQPAATPAPGDAVPAAPVVTPALRLIAAVELSARTDHARWNGVTMIGCGRVGGRFCVGGEASLANDRGGWGPIAEVEDSARSSAELLVIAALPLTTGRWSLIPMAGLGMDWMRVTVDATDEDPAVSAHTVGVRAGAMVLTTFAISTHWAVAALLIGSAGNRLMASSDGDFAERVGTEGIALADSGIAQVRAGLGVQYSQ